MNPRDQRPVVTAHTPTPATEAVTSEAAPIGGLDEISSIHSNLAVTLCSVEQLAGLLETLADKGFSNASAAKDDWQMRWWEQAQCLATMLERAATEMKAEADAIYSIVYDIQHRGRAQ
jgi:hypothetical protein